VGLDYATEWIGICAGEQQQRKFLKNSTNGKTIDAKRV